MKFLIDECLTVQLVTVAGQAGFEAYHVAHVGKAGWKDWHVVQHASAQDFVLVTNNAVDFRELYATQPLHAGLVILIPNVDGEMQQRLFTGALEQLAQHGEPINQVLEVDLDGEEATFTFYALPSALKNRVGEGTVRIANETTPVNAATAKGDTSRTADPAFGIWRDHEITADVDAYVQELRAPRYRRDGTRNDD